MDWFLDDKDLRHERVNENIEFSNIITYFQIIIFQKEKSMKISCSIV